MEENIKNKIKEINDYACTLISAIRTQRIAGHYKEAMKLWDLLEKCINNARNFLDDDVLESYNQLKRESINEKKETDDYNKLPEATIEDLENYLEKLSKERNLSAEEIKSIVTSFWKTHKRISTQQDNSDKEH